MMNVFTTTRIFGWYSLLIGCVLLLVPQHVLPIFHLPLDGETWLRLLGFVLLCSSYYYIRMSRSANIEFARLTIHTRLLAPLVVLALIAAGKASWHFASFGIVDGLGGLWTLFALRKYMQSSM